MSGNRSGHVVAAAVVCLILPTVAVILRFLSRRMARAGLWVDDYVVVLAMVFSWGPNIVNLLGVRRGFGKHIGDISGPQLFEYFKYLYAFEFLYTLGMSSVKYSILCFMYRIFPIVQFRRILIGCLVFVIALTVSVILVSMFQCVPIHKFWETLAGELSHELGGRCIDVDTYFLVAGGINTVTDFALLALPIPILWSLRTGTPQKLLLTAIFTVGLTVCVVSIIRLVVLSEVDKSDITWNYVPAACWTAAEPSIAVVSACLPSLRPLFVRLIWRNTHRPKLSSSKHLTSWRSNKKQSRTGSTQGSFNRLNEFSTSLDDSGGTGLWNSNTVKVFGGTKPKRGSGGKGKREEVELEDHGSEAEVPLGRIRAKTEVVLTISDRVDWRDDLF
ncbi:MAG: hypothetical protein L6R41_005636 [Letrouitia leprolyta]|nr:MAG: hypothetical protein L6R41_005636 [Letrouitia leprolyta]